MLSLVLVSSSLAPLSVHESEKTVLAAPGAAKHTQGPKVFLIHYHKTGWEITHDIAEVFSQESKAWPTVNIYTQQNERGRSLDDLLQERVRNHRVVESPDLSHFNPATGLMKMPPGSAIYHFVRDPLDMAVSYYLYHKGDPPPETWPGQMAPCPADRFSKLWIQKQAAPVVPPGDMDALLNMCTQLAAKATQNRTYATALRSLEESDSIKLAFASFAATSDCCAGPDVLRMAVNAYKLDEAASHAKQVNYTKVSVKDFSNDLTGSIKRISQSLLSAPLSEGVVGELQAAFVMRQGADSSRWKGAHKTSGSVSEYQRAILKQTLTNDPVTGKVLKLLRDAMNKRGSQVAPSELSNSHGYDEKVKLEATHELAAELFDIQ